MRFKTKTNKQDLIFRTPAYIFYHYHWEKTVSIYRRNNVHINATLRKYVAATLDFNEIKEA